MEGRPVVDGPAFLSLVGVNATSRKETSMSPRLACTVIFTVLAAVTPGTASFAASVWIEAGVDGDLSDVGQTPTPLTFVTGKNTIQGTMGTPFLGDLDPDIFTIALSAGQQLTSIVVDSITPGQNSFFAISAGATIDMFNGSTHLSNFLIGEPGEYFPRIAAPEFGGTGHAGPLGPGTYTVWFQETQLQRDYAMSYTVVPESSGVMLATLALLTALPTSRCRRHPSGT